MLEMISDRNVSCHLSAVTGNYSRILTNKIIYCNENINRRGFLKNSMSSIRNSTINYCFQFHRRIWQQEVIPEYRVSQSRQHRLFTLP
jgi:hypothetical protein